MCGFVVLADKFQKIDHHSLIKLRDLLSHRGPDDSGLHMSSDLQIGLGFRRLSIIDLSSAGNQPMSNEDGSIWIVFNGEVYNFGEIRPELENRGHYFRSKTDTEVILHAYEEWGEECVQKFIGMFAFVIWDNRKKKLFAARDRLGIKPLYYSDKSNRIILASELKPIIHAPGFDKKIDSDALRGYLAHGYVSSPRTIFQSAKSLRPGHLLVWSQDKREISVRQYWNPLDHISDGAEQGYTDYEWLSSLENILRSSVKYRLISDVPLGVFLSGGIDSSLIAALMRQISNSEVKTFTVRFDEAEYDEGGHAEKVAEHLGTTHTQLWASYQDAKTLIRDLPMFYDEPFADSSQIPTMLVSRLARQHVKVALSGDGGDELFCGYETYRLMDKWQLFWKLPQAIRGLVRHIVSYHPKDRYKLAAQGLMLPDPLMFASYFNGIWRPHEIDSLLPQELNNHQIDDYAGEKYSGVDELDVEFLEKLMLIDLQRYLPNDILTKVDRASMAASLEARVPILDHRVVELALKMPLSLKRKNGRSKFALRKILYQYVPPELVDRQKQGFGVPLDHWLKTDLYELLDKCLDPVFLRKQGLFNVGVVQHQINRFMAGQASHSRVWSLIMFQLWAERYMGLEV